jgi:SAM-dependent methyltransferase
VLTLQNLVIVAIVALLYMLHKTLKRKKISEEGFDQRDQFVLKQDHEKYDDFYCHLYDILANTETRAEWELKQVLKMTEPTTANSVILDVGCGCGKKVDQLQKAGFKAYGIDSSKAMVEQATRKYPDIPIQEGDVMEPMQFDKSTFSHILCTHFTLYELENKMDFFRNCYSWMIPNGYLILHLVDPEQFNAIVPAAMKNRWRNRDPHQRLTDALVKFHDFQYHAHYEFSKEKKMDSTVEFTETFTDNVTGKVRKNEQTLYMDSISDILKMANRAGFLFHGKVTMKECNQDDNQYLFVLERMM